ncbi:MAG: rhamnogalacturonan acetylesterase [Opitutaceae bacterium]
MKNLSSLAARAIVFAGITLNGFSAAPATTPAPLRFAFGSEQARAGFTLVKPDMTFTVQRGFGFEEGSTATAGARSVVSDKPFYFSVRVPEEGNYRVTVTLGDAKSESTTTIKAELRRLMVEKVHTAPGKFETVSFIVNTRTPKIAAVGDIKAGDVRLKAPRETTQEAWGWDDAITLEFNNAHAAVSAIEIAKVELPTLFLIGDSTVCDQSREPFNSWGQMLTRFIKTDLAVANHGESGETYRDSIGRRRLDKMLSVMKPGDFMLMQFGHNDQKQIASGTGGPFTTYKEEIKKHVDAVRAHGGTPIIVSPMERRGFDDKGKVKPSLADYAVASHQAAQELGVAFIDLNAMSIPFYESLEAHGAEYSRKAFAGQDNTHHNNYGSYELAKCIVQSIRAQKLPLAKFIVDDFKGFDPAHPDPVDSFSIPASALVTNQRPLGDEAAAAPAAK